MVTPEKAVTRIRQLEKEIEDLQRRWPAHSVPPAMLQHLEDLEEELDQLRRRVAQASRGE